MNITFKPPLSKAWTLTEDRIILGNKEIMLSSIGKALHDKISFMRSNGSIQVFYGTGVSDFAVLMYPKKQQEAGEKAAQFILEKVQSNIEEYNKLKKEGFRKYCNVCGHIFCYSLDDLNKNKHLAKSAAASSLYAIAGPMVSSATSLQSAENSLSRIVDYSKCPKCGSKDLTDATDADIERSKAPHVSSADELKKYKDLLDTGVITQEEFDAKKKQLLSL